jgi:CRISPR-associated endonuclease/helicase Cas3
LVRYSEGDKLIDLLKFKGPDRGLMRKLQRYTVNVYNEEFNLLLQRGSIVEVQPGIFALTSSIEYSRETGLMVDETLFDPEDLIQ